MFFFFGKVSIFQNDICNEILGNDSLLNKLVGFAKEIEHKNWKLLKNLEIELVPKHGKKIKKKLKYVVEKERQKDHGTMGLV